MCDEREQDRDVQDDDEQALEEIRQLFARYRRIARHGMVTEPHERVDEREEDKAFAGRLYGADADPGLAAPGELSRGFIFGFGQVCLIASSKWPKNASLVVSGRQRKSPPARITEY